MKSKAKILAIALLALESVACTHVQPWERGKLAHPTMATSSFSGPAEEHVYAVHEGAAGGGIIGRGGVDARVGVLEEVGVRRVAHRHRSISVVARQSALSPSVSSWGCQR